MSRNIVLCCDGTANEFAQDKTNVVKLYSMLVQDPARQATYYHPGLGTMEPPGALTTTEQWVTRLMGKAFGAGLSADLRDAYVFLMNSYSPGDRVYLFGFSRGAFTARAIASVLSLYGVIRPGNEPLVPYAIRMLTSIFNQDGGMNLAHAFKNTFSRVDCKPHFVGVWDTVSSVGWVNTPLKIPFTANNPDIAIGRHAISIDERRAFFRTNLWRPATPPVDPGPKDLKQVWFPGVHCDVGGGYPDSESGLAKVVLEWMLAEGRAAGLLIDDAKKEAVLASTGNDRKMHESLTPPWWLGEFILKPHYNWTTRRTEHRMNLFRRRTIPPHSLVHESAFQMGEPYVQRLPKDAVMVKTLPAST